jgi:ABC-type multidrug transport system fused ATPase/permease subunit
MKDKNLFKQRITVFLKMLRISFRLSYESSPAILIFRLFAMMISSLVPIINLLAIKKITDSLVVYNNSVLKTWLIILIITQILMNALSKLTNYLSTIHSDKLSLLVSKNIINKVNEIDISYFDDPKFFDEINNVTRDVNTIPNFIWILLSTLQVLIQFGMSAVILSKFGFVFPIIITLSCLPNFIIEKKFALKMYNWTRNSMNDVRRMNYSYQTLIGKEFAKDVRINSLTGYLKEKFVYQWNEWFKNKKEILNRQFIISFLTIFLPNITSLSFVIFLVYKIAHQEASIGDFSYYLGMATQLISYTFLLISNVANIIQQREKIEYYNNFMDWKPLVQYKINGQVITEFNSLEFQNVSFKYPNTDTYVLENITFQINERERIALIGKNGSGKFKSSGAA